MSQGEECSFLPSPCSELTSPWAGGSGEDIAGPQLWAPRAPLTASTERTLKP